MTNDEMRKAIAEHLGWQKFADAADLGGECWFKTHEGYKKNVPNYAEDLNAMHEAEKTLTRSQQEVFADHIIRLSPFDKTNGFDWMHATATQRAEAFLRTIGKWRGE